MEPIGLATIAGRQRRNEEAQALFRKVVALRPDDPVVRMNLGNSLAITGDLDEAIGEYQTAIKLRSNFVKAIANLANVNERRQRFGEAEQQYLKALRFPPDHTLAKANLSRVRTATSTRAHH